MVPEPAPGAGTAGSRSAHAHGDYAPPRRAGSVRPRAQGAAVPYSEYCSTTLAMWRAHAAQNGLIPLLNMMQSVWERYRPSEE